MNTHTYKRTHPYKKEMLTLMDGFHTWMDLETSDAGYLLRPHSTAESTTLQIQKCRNCQ